METKSYLLPYICQKVGWWLFRVSLVLIACLLILEVSDAVNNVNIPDWMSETTVWLSFAIPYSSIALICLSREKVEDEYISSIRSRSVFIVVVYAFIASLFRSFCYQVGVLLYGASFVGIVAFFSQWLIHPFILAIVFQIIFKGTLIINKIKARNDE